MKIELQISHVRALLHLAAKNDVRAYLNALFLETGPHETRLVAMQGHVLGAARQHVSEEQTTIPSMIIPRDALETCIKMAPKYLKTIDLTDHDDGTYVLSCGQARIDFAALSGNYPDYRRVIPRSVKPEAGPCQVNVEYLALFAKVAKELGANCPAAAVMVAHGSSRLDSGQITHSNCIIEIVGHPEFAGVLMPLRVNEADVPTGGPEWVYCQVTEAEPVAA